MLIGWTPTFLCRYCGEWFKHPLTRKRGKVVITMMVAVLLSLAAAVFVIHRMTTIGAAGDRGQSWSLYLFRFRNKWQDPWRTSESVLCHGIILQYPRYIHLSRSLVRVHISFFIYLTSSCIVVSISITHVFLLRWSPRQQSDLTLVEVSQHAYTYLCVRGVWLFAYSWNLWKPDMLLVSVLLNEFCLSLILS